MPIRLDAPQARCDRCRHWSNAYHARTDEYLCVACERDQLETETESDE